MINKLIITSILFTCINFIGFAQSTTLYPFQKDGKYGYRSGLGEVIVPAQFDTAYNFKFGRGYILQNGKIGVIDHTGEFIFEPNYAYHQAFIEKGLRSPVYVVGNKNKRGLVSKYDQLLLPVKFDSIYWSGVPSFYLAQDKNGISIYKLSQSLDSISEGISTKMDSVNIVRAGHDFYFETFKKKTKYIYNTNFKKVDQNAIDVSNQLFKEEQDQENKESQEHIKNSEEINDMSPTDSNKNSE